MRHIERVAARNPMRSSRGVSFRVLALAAFLSVAVAVVVAPVAHAEDPQFPSWADVDAVRSDEAAQQALVDQITASLAGLEAVAESARADAEVKGGLYREADQAFQEQASRTATLQAQADEANALAAESETRAGQLVAQLYRAGNGDLTLGLLIAADPEAMLDRLGAMQKVGEQATRIYERALQDRNSAQAQTEAAEAATEVLEEYRVEAEAAFAAAQEASIAAAAALETAQTAKAEADAKLTVLAENRAATEADYVAGVVARTGAGASLGAGEISLSGWAKPVNGWISDSFGWRIHPISGGWTFHSGTDIAADCGAPIYAAASGVVTYAGSNGGYGNYVEIDHGGISTGYAHTQWGAILVGVGQAVEVGQQISSVGTTGNSTGCHLHLEARRGGVAEDAAGFLSNQGVPLG